MVQLIRVRKATDDDADSIQRLSVQLGYEPPPERVRKSLAVMLSHPDYEVLVITKSGAVAGWMTLNVRHRVEGEPFLQVIGIVTDHAIRGQGLGTRLMAYAEEVAKARALPFVGLYSSKRRVEAHEFYKRLGFAQAKESYFFRKDVAGSD